MGTALQNGVKEGRLVELVAMHRVDCREARMDGILVRCSDSNPWEIRMSGLECGRRYVVRYEQNLDAFWEAELIGGC